MVPFKIVTLKSFHIVLRRKFHKDLFRQWKSSKNLQWLLYELVCYSHDVGGKCISYTALKWKLESNNWRDSKLKKKESKLYGKRDYNFYRANKEIIYSAIV